MIRPGSFPRVRFMRRDERRVRASESHRNSKTLSATDTDVSAPFSRRRDQCECEQVGGCDGQAIMLFGFRPPSPA